MNEPSIRPIGSLRNRVYYVNSSVDLSPTEFLTSLGWYNMDMQRSGRTRTGSRHSVSEKTISNVQLFFRISKFYVPEYESV
jgi:hypothetical protein